MSNGKIPQVVSDGEQKDPPDKGRLNLMPKKSRLTTHEKKLLSSRPAAIFFLWYVSSNGKGKSTCLCVL
jgi:hypothetical protein